MKVHYDEEIDALYIELSKQEPDGVIEITEGINIDTTNGSVVDLFLGMESL